ncbi:Hypothetical predicted protein [Marmota monax]|uniref:Flavin-containing monooxygenase n=1 Tax=Marmota monax TaxID=9995 RepID=A0A5E4CI43_MARMO|nr:Hypothetical predicted protein [Marmota monax]
MTAKKIAVIGAGVSGLGAIKSCLEEGLEPTCFEKGSDIGGLWRYEETPDTGRAGIYKSLTCNTSKEMTAFSDYPVPDHFPNYMHNSKMMEYLRMYARHFGLMQHIEFLAKVCSVRKRPDFSSSGQWDVVVEADGKQQSYIFDGVMICSGHYTEKHLPLQEFAGIQKFRGRYLHSWEYKQPDSFAGKRVVVIGIGNSGADVAGEISRVAEQVFLSTRRGAWIWNRVWDDGNPMDTALFTRYNRALQKLLPSFLINRWAEKKLNARFNHANYGLQAAHRYVHLGWDGQAAQQSRWPQRHRSRACPMLTPGRTFYSFSHSCSFLWGATAKPRGGAQGTQRWSHETCATCHATLHSTTHDHGHPRTHHPGGQCPWMSQDPSCLGPLTPAVLTRTGPPSWPHSPGSSPSGAFGPSPT